MLAACLCASRRTAITPVHGIPSRSPGDVQHGTQAIGVVIHTRVRTTLRSAVDHEIVLLAELRSTSEIRPTDRC